MSFEIYAALHFDEICYYTNVAKVADLKQHEILMEFKTAICLSVFGTEHTELLTIIARTSAPGDR